MTDGPHRSDVGSRAAGVVDVALVWTRTTRYVNVGDSMPTMVASLFTSRGTSIVDERVVGIGDLVMCCCTVVSGLGAEFVPVRRRAVYRLPSNDDRLGRRRSIELAEECGAIKACLPVPPPSGRGVRMSSPS